MEARVDTKKDVKDIEKFIEQLLFVPTNDDLAIMHQYEQAGVKPIEVANVAGKYLQLIIILHGGSLLTLLEQLGNQKLIDVNLLLALSNHLGAMEFNYNRENNKQRLLQLWAFSANPENFNAMRDRMELQLQPMNVLFPIDPIYIAAFSGNLKLLRSLHDESVNIAYPELLRFAAMGGDISVLNYLHDELHVSLNQPTESGLMPFVYSVFSNNPDMVMRFRELGYQPTDVDRKHYHTLLAGIKMTELTFLRSQAAGIHSVNNMDDALKQAMIDPAKLALQKEMRATIHANVQNVLVKLTKLREDAGQYASGYHVNELNRLRKRAENIVSDAKNEMLAYLDIVDQSFDLGLDIQTALNKMDAKLDELNNFINHVIVNAPPEEWLSPRVTSSSTIAPHATQWRRVSSSSDWQKPDYDADSEKPSPRR